MRAIIGLKHHLGLDCLDIVRYLEVWDCSALELGIWVQIFRSELVWSERGTASRGSGLRDVGEFILCSQE